SSKQTRAFVVAGKAGRVTMRAVVLTINGSVHKGRRTVKATFAGAILCVIALTGCSKGRNVGSASKWVQMTSAEGHFTAWFPHEPKHTLPSGDLIHEYVAETNGGTVAFLISYTPQADLKISLDERLATTRNVMKSTNATILSVTMCDLPAKE